MCTVVFAHKVHPKYPLILIANRDEFYERKTENIQWWSDYPNLLAGKDLEAGGTWMGVSKEGRFAVLTNYREFPITEEFSTSRGALVKDFLIGSTSPNDFFDTLQKEGKNYAGFNLVFGNNNQLHYYSNKGMEQQNLEAGIHGVSNHLLNTPWPKVEMGKQSLQEAIQSEVNLTALIEKMHNTTKAEDSLLPNTGIGLEWERVLSALFIKTEKYGTRCTTGILIDNSGQITYQEKSYIPEKNQTFQFSIQ